MRREDSEFRVVVSLVDNQVRVDRGVRHPTGREHDLGCAQVYGHVERAPSGSLVEELSAVDLLGGDGRARRVDAHRQNLSLAVYLPPRELCEIDVEREVLVHPRLNYRRHSVEQGVNALVVVETVPKREDDRPPGVAHRLWRDSEDDQSDEDADEDLEMRLHQGPLKVCGSSQLVFLPTGGLIFKHFPPWVRKGLFAPGR